MYAPRTTESILWALFFHRLDGFISLKAKIKAINDCLACIEPRFKNKECIGELTEIYTKKEIEEFEQILLKFPADKQALRDDTNVSPQGGREVADFQIALILQNYDIGFHYLLHLLVGALPPVVTQGRYGYEYHPGIVSHTRPNCHETAILDFFSILWHDPVKRMFNNDLFDQRIIEGGQGFRRLRQALKYLYLADCKGIDAREYTCEHEADVPKGARYRNNRSAKQNVRFTSIAKLKSLERITQKEVEQLDISEVPVDYINRPEIKQEFFNIVSNIPGIFYRSSIQDNKEPVFEIRSNELNLLKICNYFYGVEAQRIDDLTGRIVGLSTESRTIAVRKKSKKDVIRINVADQDNNTEFNLDIKLGKTHTSLVVFDREKKASSLLQKGAAEYVIQKIFHLPTDKRDRLTSLFTLLNTQKLLKNKMLFRHLPFLHLIFYSLGLKNSSVKIALLRDILKRHPYYYEHCKEMIHNLIQKLPQNNRDIKRQLVELIINTGFYKHPFFEKYIKFKVLNDPIFFQDHARVGDIFWSALVNKCELVIRGILENPHCNSWEYLLVVVLENKQEDIAMQIVKNPKFKANFKNSAKLLQLALEHGYRKVAAVIAKKMTGRGGSKSIIDVFSIAIKKGYLEIALELAKHIDLSMSSYKVGKIFLQLLKAENIEIVLAMLNNPTLKMKPKGLFVKALLMILKKGDERLALSLVYHPLFDATLERGDNDFDEEDFFDAIEDSYSDEKRYNGWVKILMVALKGGYKQVAWTIVNHPKFGSKGDKMGEALVLAFEYEHLFPEPPLRDGAGAPPQDNRGQIEEETEGEEEEEIVLRQAQDDEEEIALRLPAYAGAQDNRGQLEREEEEEIEEEGESDDEGPQVQNRGHQSVVQGLIETGIIGFFASGSDSSSRKNNLKKEEVHTIAGKIIYGGKNKFEYWAEALIYAMKHGYIKAALKIVEHPECKMKNYKMGEALVWALLQPPLKYPSSNSVQDKGMGSVERNQICLKIAEKIMKHSQFEDWMGAVGFALSKDYKKFRDKLFFKGQVSVPELQQEMQNIKIALYIFRHPGFTKKVRSYDFGAVFVLLNQLIESRTDRPECVKVYQQIIQNMLENATSSNIGAALLFALRKKNVNMALHLIKYPKFDPTDDYLVKHIVSELVGDRKFRWPSWDERCHYLRGSDPIFKCPLYKKLILELLKFPNLAIDSSKVGSSVAYLLENKDDKEVITALVNHPNFKGWGEALALALRVDNRKVVAKIMKHSKFRIKDNKMGQAVVDAWDSRWYGGFDSIWSKWWSGKRTRTQALDELVNGGQWMDKIAEDIMKHPDFDEWGYILEYALSEGKDKLIAKIVSHPRFHVRGPGMVNALLAALGGRRYRADHHKDNRYRGLVFRIGLDPTLNLARDPNRWDSMRELLEELVKKQGYKEVIVKILDNPTIQTRSYVSDALRLFVNNKEYHDLAKKIMDSSTFIKDDGWCFYLWRALENQYKEMAFIIINHPKFKVGGHYVGFAIADALRNKEYKDIVEKIVNHPTLDFNASDPIDDFCSEDEECSKQSLGQSILSQVQKFVEKHPDRAKDLQDVIEILMSKQKKKKE